MNSMQWSPSIDLSVEPGCPIAPAVLVKGILSPRDAALAVDAGCDGIVVSPGTDQLKAWCSHFVEGA